MTASLWRLALGCALATAATGCAEELPPILVDISKNCNEVEVTVVIPRLGDHRASEFPAPQEVVDVAADGAEPGSAWTLVVPGDGDPAVPANLAVQRIIDDRVVRQATLDVPAANRASMRLVSSPVAGEVYAVRELPGTFRVWKVSQVETGVIVQGSTELASFPNDTHSCPTTCDVADWPRRLIFLDREPYLMALPPESPTVAISVWIGELSSGPSGGGAFSIAAEHRLNFEPRCEPGLTADELALCEANKALVSHPAVGLLATQNDPRPGTFAMLAYRERQEEGLPLSTRDVFVVHVFLDDDRVPQGILRSEEVSQFGTMPPPGEPTGVAVDGFATYALVTAQPVGTKLLRLSSLEQGFEEVALELDDGHRLLQLDSDLALARLEDGVWEIDKLFPDAVEQSQITIYEGEGPIDAIEAAGPGLFALHREGTGTELVRVECAEPDIPDGG